MAQETRLTERDRVSWPAAVAGSLLLVGASLLAGTDVPHEPARSGPTSAPLPRFAGSERADRPYWRRNLFKRVLVDQKHLLTTWWPTELRRPALLAPLAASTAVAATSAGQESGLDLQIERYVDSAISGKATGAAEKISRLGNRDTAIVLIGSTFLLARWRGNDRLAAASSLSAEALLNSAIWNVALKRLAARTRPTEGGRGNFFVHGGAGELQVGSFPSGHAMGAFAVATVFAHEYRDRRWVPWLAYGAAGLIGASRVALGRHFPSDIVAGALLGHSLGRMVISRDRGIEDRPLDRLRPTFDPHRGGYGLTYTHSW